MEWSGKAALACTPFTNMTINGKAVAAIQNVENFSFAYVILLCWNIDSFSNAFAGGSTRLDMKW